MALRTLARFRNPDITSDINHRLRDLVTKGVFSGGQVSPVASLLEIDVQPFASIGADGLVTILEGTSERLSVGIGTQWVLLHAEYQANNVAIAELEVLTEAQYNALTAAGKTARAKLAKLDIGVGAVEVTLDDISYLEADFTDPVDRSAFRGTVTTATALPDYSNPPTGLSQFNRDGDHYLVLDERVFYGWDTTGTAQWRPIISSAGEAALNSHRNNDDDGTVPPDLFEAQHITVKENNAFKAGSASQVKHGTAGFEFNALNPIVDAKYPVAARARWSGVTGGAVTAFQLLDTVYVGSGVIGTAVYYLTLTDGVTSRPLSSPTDAGRIKIQAIFDSTNTFQINPSTDADALGFVVNPWIRMDFSETADVSFNGTVGVQYGYRSSLGELEVAAPLTPFPMPAASDMPLPTTGFTNGMEALADKTIKGGFDWIDANYTAFGSTVRTIGPVGSGAHYVGASHAPFQEALNDANDGDVIVVLAGTYTFTSKVTVSGKKGLRITSVGPLGYDSGTGLPYLQNGGTNQTLFEFTDCENITLSNAAFNEAKQSGATDGLIEFAASGAVNGFKVLRCFFTLNGLGNYSPTIQVSGAGPVMGVEISQCHFFMNGQNANRIYLDNCVDYKICGNTFQNSATGTGSTTGTQIQIEHSSTSTLTAHGWIQDNALFAGLQGSFCNIEVPQQATTSTSLTIENNNIQSTGADGYACFFLAGATTANTAEGAIVSVNNNKILWGNATYASTVILSIDGTNLPGVVHVTNNHWETIGELFNNFGAPGGCTIKGNWFKSQQQSATVFASTAPDLVWESNTYVVAGQAGNNYFRFRDRAVVSNSYFQRLPTSAGDNDWTVLVGLWSAVSNCTFDFRDAAITGGSASYSFLRLNDQSCTVTGCKFLGNATAQDATYGLVTSDAYCTVTGCYFQNLRTGAFGSSHFTVGDCTFYSVAEAVNCTGGYLNCINCHIDTRNHPELGIVGAVIYSGSYSVISGNHIDDTLSITGSVTSYLNPWASAAILAGSQCTISGNVIRQQYKKTTGIYCTAYTNVTGNSISDVGNLLDTLSTDICYGVYYNGDYIEVTNNIIDHIGGDAGDNPGRGVGGLTSGDQYVTISDNNIRTMRHYDTNVLSVGINSTGDQAVVNGNNLLQCYTGIQYFTGSISNNRIQTAVRGVVPNHAGATTGTIIDSNYIDLDEVADAGAACSGIQVYGNSQISNNIITGNFSVSATSGNTSTDRSLVYAQGSYNIVTGNALQGGSDRNSGILLSGSPWDTVCSNNSIGNDLGGNQTNTISGISSGYIVGILVDGPDTANSGWVTLNGNNFFGSGGNDIGNATNAGLGIMLEGIDRCLVSNCNFRGGTYFLTALLINSNCDEITIGPNSYGGLGVLNNGTNSIVTPVQTHAIIATETRTGVTGGQYFTASNHQIPANRLSAGSTIRVRAGGEVTTLGTNCSVGVSIKDQTGHSITLTNFSALSGTGPWSMEAYFTVRGVGTGVTILGHCHGSSTNGADAFGDSQSNNTFITTEAFDVRGFSYNDSTGGVITLEQFIVEIV